MNHMPSELPPSEIPTLQPPPGIKPNVVDPPSLANMIIIVHLVFLALMLIALTIRIYTKGVLLRSLWWDDYTAMIATAGSIAQSGFTINATRYGFGRRQWDYPLSLLHGNAIRLEVEAIIAYSVILFVKLSALLLYIRLFSVNRLLHWLIWAGINIQVIAWAAFIGHIIGLHVVCKDFENSTEKAVCLNVSKAICVQAFFNFLTDCYVLLLPITVVLKMQMSVQRKIGMVLIFMTGLLACAGSLARAVIIIHRLHTKEIHYEAIYMNVFGVVEMNMGIIAGALITFPVFISKSGIAPFAKSILSFLRSHLLGRGSNRTPKQINEEMESFGKFKRPKKELLQEDAESTDGE